MTGKSIQPRTTAKQLAQKNASGGQQMPASQKAELDRCRQEALKLGLDLPESVRKRMEKPSVDINEPSGSLIDVSDKQINSIDRDVYHQSHDAMNMHDKLMSPPAESMSPPPPPAPPVALATPDFPFDASKNFKFRVPGGRIITMGQPSNANVMNVGDVFIDRDKMDLKLLTQMKVHKVVSYIRNINGRELNEDLTHWYQVAGIVKELGDIAYNCCADVFDTYWPEGGAPLWQAVKND